MKRHPLDTISLVFGLAFASLGGLYVAGLLDLRVVGLQWLAGGFLLILGLVLVLSAARSDRSDGDA